MRELLRNMAKAKMAKMGYSKINKRMNHGRWRKIIGAYPTNLVSGILMSKGFHGEKKYKAGHVSHLFAY